MHHPHHTCPLLLIYHPSHTHLSLSLPDIPTAGIESDLDEVWYQRQLSVSMEYVGSGKSGKSNGSGGKSGKSNGSGSSSGSGGKSGKSGSKSVRSCYL